MIKKAARFVLLTGIVLLGISLLLLPYQEKDSPQGIINWLNLVIGLLMISSALIFLRRDRRKYGKERDRTKTIDKEN